MEWYLKVINSYFDFSGRSRRMEYWMFVFINSLISILCFLLDNMLGTTWAIGYGPIYIGYGLAVFGIGSSVAGIGSALTAFTDPEWAQGIVDNVTTLLSISSLPGVLLDTGVFVTAMTGIAAGIVAFSAAEGFAAAIGYFTGGDTVDNIKTNVTKAMSILLLQVCFWSHKYQGNQGLTKAKPRTNNKIVK